VDAGNVFGPGTGEILLDDVECLGTETSLADCQHGEWGQHNCVHDKDVSVVCLDKLGTPMTCNYIQGLQLSSNNNAPL